VRIGQTAAWTGRHFITAAAITAFALLVRLYYVHSAVVVSPVRGDAVQYMIYAINLLDHHVFSMQTEGMPLADGFRDPGYPTFLALLMAFAGRGEVFYLTTLNIQCLLSAATVAMYIVLTRRWLGMAAATVVGLGLALWPHSITLAGYLLSETLVGFLFVLALLLLQIACDRRSPRLGAIAGLTIAMATLTNATLLPIIPLFAVIAAWRDRSRRVMWSMVLLGALIPAAAWAIRGAYLPPGSNDAAGDRVAMNFVQGSWPEYHAAWSATVIGREEAPKAILRAIGAEYDLLREDRATGLAAMAGRMSQDPSRYLMWYLGKPAELWGWTIGIGNGDIYVFPTYQSPLSQHGPLRVTTDLLFIANPLLMSLALIGLIVVAASAKKTPASLRVGALAVALLTAIFTALQADARYAVPYRGMEWVLAVTGGIWLTKSYRDLRRRIRAPMASRLRDTSVTTSSEE
jgi:4-amino-4-deoxy-L-arabinose transferase-like glycosyltransferase